MSEVVDSACKTRTNHRISEYVHLNGITLSNKIGVVILKRVYTLCEFRNY